jgi:hypothetical protein
MNGIIIFTHKGYDVYFDGEYYGIVAEGEPKPYCVYKYLYECLMWKGL